MTMRYEVREDNGGGLELLVWEDGKLTYRHTGYEYHPGALTDDLDSLRRDGNTVGWDGNQIDALGRDLNVEYSEKSRCSGGWKLVTEGDGS